MHLPMHQLGSFRQPALKCRYTSDRYTSDRTCASDYNSSSLSTHTLELRISSNGKIQTHECHPINCVTSALGLRLTSGGKHAQIWKVRRCGTCCLKHMLSTSRMFALDHGSPVVANILNGWSHDGEIHAQGSKFSRCGRHILKHGISSGKMCVSESHLRKWAN